MVICALLIARYLGHRNFEKYVSKVEQERFEEVALALGQEYSKNRNWESIVKNWGHWLRLTPLGPGQPPGPPLMGEPPPPLSAPPPVPAMGADPRDAEPAHFGEPPPVPPPPDDRSSLPLLALFDADKQPLTKALFSSTHGYRMFPVVLRDGATVGWLGVRKVERPAHPLDVEFLRRLTEMFYWIGGIALLVAALVSFMLSRHILEPVKKLAEGTHALTSRKFDTRIEVRSQDEIGQLAADFNAMAVALERYERTRRQWVADISHELRTPLAILRGEIEAMQDGVREITAEALGSLHAEVVHVSRIVQDLHDISLIESETMVRVQTKVSPFDILEESLKIFQGRFTAKGMVIHADLEGIRQHKTLADACRLRQLYSNLLENTLRYADAPGVLTISHDLRPDGLLLSFEDSGPGVPAEALDQLFDRLYRVDKARSRTNGGSGLGLAICKSIMESIGGRIEASSGPSGGLKITLIFGTVQ